MIYRFGSYGLDTDKFELRSDGSTIPLEPQVFALLRLLIENRERMVTRDEVIEKIWNGRIVSEAAISSRVKSARRAVGDDGASQRIIRTLPKQGFRFIAEVEAGEGVGQSEPGPRVSDVPEPPIVPAPRPSIAVLPFDAIGVAGQDAWIAEALPHDLIAELSRLRWLFVIARGSSFRFRGPEAEVGRVRDMLGVRYCLSGAVEKAGADMTITVELCDTSDSGVVWSERFRLRADAVHEVREQIVMSVINALDLQIPLHEAQRARLTPSEDLNAWSAFHLGLHHMYRFNRDGALLAAGYFQRAIDLDPGFARAHAGLSFTHFERAFLRFADDAGDAAALARKYAETSLERDPVDPFCNLVMGRVFWLHGDLEASLPWFERAISLNPNYAQGMYSRAWTESLLGRGQRSREDVDAALQLSPLDPLAYGMNGVRAFAHIVQDEPAAAAEWAERAARSPGAHALIEMIAAAAHGLNGDEARARTWLDSARRRHPGLSSADFFDAFPFREPASRARIAAALGSLGA